MDGPTLNHYEEQLYSMFKSFDLNNEEALDESAVHDLCDALQLEERGAALADTLFESGTGRVTFERFRSGLLAVLGDAAPAAPRPPEPPPAPADAGDAGSAGGASEEGSAELEPRFVLGDKRYGRRSRPPPRAASAERARPASPPRARRSASAAPPLQHAARLDGGEAALALCRDLRIDGIDRRLVERIFEDSPGSPPTVGEFFERLDSTLAREVDDVAGSAAAGAGAAPSERLLERWERAGVARPRLLLAELGFGEVAPAAPALEDALDAELHARGDDGPGRARLLLAALALARLGREDAGARAAAAAAERDKLRADVAEANDRAALLAREVDESHARLEREAAEGLRRARARHADEARRARAEADAELERAAAERARLEAELARRADADARRQAELDELRRRARALEEGAGQAAAALEAARAERARLQERLRAAEDSARAALGEAALGAEARAALGELTREHRRERERADELAAALEAARAPPAPRAPPAREPDLSAELGELLAAADREPESGGGATVRPAEETPSTEDADEERERLRELVGELERALEAMRGEYEACEEYWAGKQRSERAAHEAELRAADARLAALLARVAAFERRLAPPPPALAAVPELPALEDQVAALEAERAADARAAAARLARAHEQLARAQRRLAALQRRREPEPAPAPGCARCGRLAAGAAAAAARAAAAEAAARRLQARLLAADLLLKELYVENCSLARPLP